MNQPQVGVGVIVRRGYRVLLHKRKSDHAFGKWAFPGGHLEFMEDLADCALRELKEEAGNVIVTRPTLFTASNTLFPDENKHYVVVFMVCDWISGEATLEEPDKAECWEWFSWDILPSPLIPGIQDLVNRGLNPFER